jgi:hypothetical protein
MAFLAIGYNLTKGWRLGTNLVGILGLTLVIGAMFTTGSRTPIYVLLGTSPIVLGSAVIRGLLPLQTAVRLFLALPIMAVGALSISPRAFEAFMERVNDPAADNTSSRLTDTVLETVNALSNAPPLGFGIGTAHPSSLMIMGAEWPWWLGDSWMEAEIARVTTELGVVGLILIYVARILIAIWAVRSTISFTDPVYRAFGIVLAIYLGLSILQAVIFDATAGLFYWGAAGLVMTMCRFQAEKQRRSALLIRPNGLRLSTVHAN